MAKKTARRADPTAVRTRVADLERSLALCTDRIDQLERELQTNIKRMGAIQAELDHLRARALGDRR
jgi:hypothetical protein